MNRIGRKRRWVSIISACVLAVLPSDGINAQARNTVKPRPHRIIGTSKMWSLLEGSSIYSKTPEFSYQWRSSEELVVTAFWPFQVTFPVFSVNVKSGACRKLEALTAACGDILSPNFILSPNGEWFLSAVWSHLPGYDGSHRYVAVKFDGSKRIIISANAWFELEPGAFCGDNDHFIGMDARGTLNGFSITSSETLSEHPIRSIENLTRDRRPNHSATILGRAPSGDAIALWRFLVDGDESPSLLDLKSRLGTIAAHTTKLRVPRGARLDEYALSPSGDRIAWIFAVLQPAAPFHGRTEVWLSDTRGGGMKRIASRSVTSGALYVTGHFRKMRWMPGGRSVSVVLDDDLLAIDVPTSRAR